VASGGPRDWFERVYTDDRLPILLPCLASTICIVGRIVRPRQSAWVPTMPRKRRRLTFRQTDVCRLLRAYKAAGVAQPTVRITKEGDLIAIPSPSDLPDTPEPNGADAADQEGPA
jgi:hypothetical protein